MPFNLFIKGDSIVDIIKKVLVIVDKILFRGCLYRIYSKIGQNDQGQKYSEEYCSQLEEFKKNPQIRQEIYNVDPKKLLTLNRLDIVVRYLLFRDMIWGNISDANKSLYYRMILSRTGGKEPQDFYSPESKDTIEAHLDTAKKLYASIRERGFREEGYVPIADDLGLFNGAHRIACAMALNKDIWVRICGSKGVRDFDINYFKENGFSRDDIIRILRGYADIHKESGLFITYGPVFDKWDYILNDLKKTFSVVGWVDLNFSGDYVGFINLIHDVYCDYNQEGVIANKANLLLYAPLVLRVILVSDEIDDIKDLNGYDIEKKAKDFFSRIIESKSRIRDLLKYDCQKEAYATIHATDDRMEFDSLKQVVLSVNNLKCISLRPLTIMRKTFMRWLDELKEWLSSEGYDYGDVCIVGSSPLEVFDIRESTDIDIVVSPEMRIIYGNGITHISSHLDIVTRNYVKDEGTGEVFVTDEQLIYDDDYHYLFYGLKFANLELVLKRKSSSNREKDINDVKLLSIFFEYSKNFNDKEVLKRQIEKEVDRRKVNRRQGLKPFTRK